MTTKKRVTNEFVVEENQPVFKHYKRVYVKDESELKRFDYCANRYCSYIGFLKYQQKKYPDREFTPRWTRQQFIDIFMNSGKDPYDRMRELKSLGLRSNPFDEAEVRHSSDFEQ